MMFRHRLACGLIILLVACVPLFGDEPTKQEGIKGVSAADAELLAKRLLAVMDVVLEHHIAPPTRQEMTLEAARTAYRHAAKHAPQHLAYKVSALSTRDQFQKFLETTCVELPLPRGPDRPTAESVWLAGVLQAVQGTPTLVSSKEAAVQQQLSGNRYVGIGVALKNEQTSGLTQVAHLFDGPGAKAGLQESDVLVAIDGTSLQGRTLQEVVDLLRGPEGTRLTLDVRAPGDPFREERSLKITRGLVPRKTIEGTSRPGADAREKPGIDIAARHRAKPGSPVAYVRLTQIGGSVAQELERLEPQLAAAGFEALILDLRSVEADDLHHAVLLIDALLDQGLIGKVETASGIKEFVADRDCLFRDWPMAVLVDAGTGGTAEWVAAALQDRGRARIIGLRTAAEPFVRSFVPIPGTDDSIRIPTGLLERDWEVELARLQNAPSNVRAPSVLPLAAGGLEKESPQNVWRVIPDRVPEGLKKLDPATQSVPFAAIRRARKGATGASQPPVAPQPPVTPQPLGAPQPPVAAQPFVADSLVKASPADDPFIADAEQDLARQVRVKKAAATN